MEVDCALEVLELEVLELELLVDLEVPKYESMVPNLVFIDLEAVCDFDYKCVWQLAMALPRLGSETSNPQTHLK